MDIRYLATLGIALLLLVAFCGCTETPTGGTSPSETKTAPPTLLTPTYTTEGSALPGPTVTLPSGREVTISVRRDQIWPTITVTFNGGRGQQFIQNIYVAVIRSDGEVKTGLLCRDSSACRMGEEITFEGTKGVDRVQAQAILITGDRYKFFDKTYDFYQHT